MSKPLTAGLGPVYSLPRDLNVMITLPGLRTAIKRKPGRGEAVEKRGVSTGAGTRAGAQVSEGSF